MSNSLRGVWAAALTPLKDDLSPDPERLVAHYRWLLANGCDGVAALGTTGEANSFSVAERRAIIDAVAGGGLPMDRIMVGTGCCAIPDTVELTRAALAAGAAGILMLPPFYYKGVSDDGLFAAYDEVIQRVGDDRMRIYVYDFPKMTGLEISVDLLARLHEAYPRTIVGVKDSSGNWADMEEACRRIAGFGTFAGTEKYLLATLRAGGAGCISATANVTCRLAAAVYASWQGPEADRLQDELTALRVRLDGYPAIPALKELMAQYSGQPSWRAMRPPMRPLGEDRVRALAADMAAANFTLADAA